jgi:hypothetical protein
MTRRDSLDDECMQCVDPNCGLYGCMKRPPSPPVLTAFKTRATDALARHPDGSDGEQAPYPPTFVAYGPNDDTA